jgi:hypothetical protein
MAAYVNSMLAGDVDADVMAFLVGGLVVPFDKLLWKCPFSLFLFISCLSSLVAYIPESSVCPFHLVFVLCPFFVTFFRGPSFLVFPGNVSSRFPLPFRVFLAQDCRQTASREPTRQPPQICGRSVAILVFFFTLPLLLP